MLTKTRLSSLVSAACDEAKTGTTYHALLALVGDSNAEWLYGWLNAQKRCRPPVLVQRADGSYIRPQYIAPPPPDKPPPTEEATANMRAAAQRRWHAHDYSQSRKALQAARRAAAYARYADALEMRKRGATYEEISRKCGFKTVKAGRELVLRARRWDAEGRPA